MPRTAILARTALAMALLLSVGAQVQSQDRPTDAKCREVCAAALKTQLSDGDKKILTQCSADKRCSTTPSINGPGFNPLIRVNPR